MSKLLFPLFARAVRPLSERNIGGKIPFFKKAYGYVYRSLRPEGINLFNVNGFKIYAEGNSFVAQCLWIENAYERKTTRLFTEVAGKG
ncbi:hypothetical protein LDC_2783, partial [sediment metagenome]